MKDPLLIPKLLMGRFIRPSSAGPLRRTVLAIFQTASQEFFRACDWKAFYDFQHRAVSGRYACKHFIHPWQGWDNYTFGRRMKTSTLLTILFLLACQSGYTNDLPSPIQAPHISSNNSEKAIEAARVRGEATAIEDIKKNIFRILYYGKPWDASKPLLDSETGYSIQIVGDCVCTEVFREEVAAYNAAMLDHHKNKPKSVDSTPTARESSLTFREENR